MSTARLGMTLLVEGQSGGEITANEAISLLDGMSFPTVINRTTSAPPATPAQGDCYLVAAAPTGVWTGHATHLALYNSGWVFVVPKEGFCVFDATDNYWMRYDGSAWTSGWLFGGSLQCSPLQCSQFGLGLTPISVQTGGAATAGATWTSAEQSMLQKAYDALRAFGFLT